MAGFILIERPFQLDKNRFDRLFEKIGYGKGYSLDSKRFSLWFYEKKLIKNKDWIENEDGFILCSGTFVYNRQSQNKSLELFLKDFSNNRINYETILGQFVILIVIGNQISIISDNLCIENLYYDKKGKIFSTSYLAVIEAVSYKISINENSLIEILLTGGLIGPETFFKEILRIESSNKTKSNDLTISNIPPIKNHSWINPDMGPIESQIEHLNNYFQSINSLAKENGALVGLTGGFDSRLLMLLGERNISEVQYFTHYRKGYNKEVQIANNLTEMVSKVTFQPKIKLSLEMNDDEAQETLQMGYYHNDGHIRSQIFWHEYINSTAYLVLLSQYGLLSLNGVGGEQYRNYERMIKKQWSFNSWLRNEVLFRNCSSPFYHKKEENKFIDHFAQKVLSKLNLKRDKKIDHLFLKRYHNEVFNISNRTVRSTMENKVYNSLCPFVDPYISYKAYVIIPALGKSLNFQAKMIRTLNPDMAKITSHYGFNFYNGESFPSKMSGYLKELIPKEYFYRIYRSVKNYNDDQFYIQYSQKFGFMKDLEERINALDLNINIQDMKNVKYNGWLLISLGFLLKKLEDKISF